jgi:hypothetical protein
MIDKDKFDRLAEYPETQLSLRDLQADEPLAELPFANGRTDTVLPASSAVKAVQRVREGFDRVGRTGTFSRERMSTQELLTYTQALLKECDQAIAELSWEDGVRPRVFLSTAQDNIDVLVTRLNSEARDG